MQYVRAMRRRLLTFVLVAAATAFLSTYWLYEGALGEAVGFGSSSVGDRAP